jgi:hypothetical protein
MILGAKKFRDSEKKIFFEGGLVTLKEFTAERANRKIPWKEEEINYLLKTLCEYVFVLAEHKIYHSDFKSANISLKRLVFK